MGQLRCEIIFANESYKVAEKPFLSWRHTQLSILPSKYNLYPAPTQLSVCSTAREKKRERKKKEVKKKKKKGGEIKRENVETRGERWTIVKPYVVGCSSIEKQSWFLVVGCLSKLPPRFWTTQKPRHGPGCASEYPISPASNSLYTEVRGLSARTTRARVFTCEVKGEKRELLRSLLHEL